MSSFNSLCWDSLFSNSKTTNQLPRPSSGTPVPPATAPPAYPGYRGGPSSVANGPSSGHAFGGGLATVPAPHLPLPVGTFYPAQPSSSVGRVPTGSRRGRDALDRPGRADGAATGGSFFPAHSTVPALLGRGRGRGRGGGGGGGKHRGGGGGGFIPPPPSPCPQYSEDRRPAAEWATTGPPPPPAAPHAYDVTSPQHHQSGAAPPPSMRSASPPWFAHDGPNVVAAPAWSFGGGGGGGGGVPPVPPQPPVSCAPWGSGRIHRGRGGNSGHGHGCAAPAAAKRRGNPHRPHNADRHRAGRGRHPQHPQGVAPTNSHLPPSSSQQCSSLQPSSSTGPPQHCCLVCDREFRTEQQLQGHREQVHHKCDEPECSFEGPFEMLEAHKMSHILTKDGDPVLANEAEMAKWVSDRKARFPTRHAIEKEKSTAASGKAKKRELRASSAIERLIREAMQTATGMRLRRMNKDGASALAPHMSKIMRMRQRVLQQMPGGPSPHGGAQQQRRGANAAAAKPSLHDEFPICQHFLRTRTCMWGDKCKWSHDVAGYRNWLRIRNLSGVDVGFRPPLLYALLRPSIDRYESVLLASIRYIVRTGYLSSSTMIKSVADDRSAHAEPDAALPPPPETNGGADGVVVMDKSVPMVDGRDEPTEKRDTDV
eukprot:GHVU01011254.1.p1 GENE.GHVU01011254.1~~GHVU01011254.1.p1  ORF type:complete len:652 (+),score=114.13 GHVU01011254.1:366-2321(+)